MPKNIHTVVKELFKAAVCIKPRLIRQGFQMMETMNNTQGALDGINRLFDHGKFYYLPLATIYKKKNANQILTYEINFNSTTIHCRRNKLWKKSSFYERWHSIYSPTNEKRKGSYSKNLYKAVVSKLEGEL